MRVYYACLAAYNNGRLHGAWVDASGDANEMEEAVQTMLAASPEDDAEEWAIHDYEMDGIRLEEYSGFDDIAAIMDMIEENAYDEGAAKVCLIEYDGDVAQANSLMENHVATVDNFKDYADELADELIYEADDLIQRYFDYEAFARDLEHDYHVVEHSDGMVYIFAN